MSHLDAMGATYRKPADLVTYALDLAAGLEEAAAVHDLIAMTPELRDEIVTNLRTLAYAELLEERRQRNEARAARTFAPNRP